MEKKKSILHVRVFWIVYYIILHDVEVNLINIFLPLTFFFFKYCTQEVCYCCMSFKALLILNISKMYIASAARRRAGQLGMCQAPRVIGRCLVDDKGGGILSAAPATARINAVNPSRSLLQENCRVVPCVWSVRNVLDNHYNWFQTETRVCNLFSGSFPGPWKPSAIMAEDLVITI